MKAIVQDAYGPRDLLPFGRISKNRSSTTVATLSVYVLSADKLEPRAAASQLRTPGSLGQREPACFLRTRVEAELEKNVWNVALDRAFRNEEPRANLLVAQAFCD